MVPAAMRGNLVKTNAGSPSEFAFYARLIHNRISGFPHKMSWLIREGTLTLTGAETYNLKTTFPDLVRVYHIPTSQVGGREVPYQSLRDYNLTPSGGARMTIIGHTLKLSGTLTGTLTIPYYSNYLVLDNDGTTRKLDFESDDDESIVPEEHTSILVEGILDYVRRKENKRFKQNFLLPDGRLVEMEPCAYHLQQAALADRPIQQGIYSLRYAPF